MCSGVFRFEVFVLFVIFVHSFLFTKQLLALMFFTLLDLTNEEEKVCTVNVKL